MVIRGISIQNYRNISTKRLKRKSSRKVADQVFVNLPGVQWTPELTGDVAKCLADALIQDLREHPPCHSKIGA